MTGARETIINDVSQQKLHTPPEVYIEVLTDEGLKKYRATKVTSPVSNTELALNHKSIVTLISDIENLPTMPPIEVVNYQKTLTGYDIKMKVGENILVKNIIPEALYR